VAGFVRRYLARRRFYALFAALAAGALVGACCRPDPCKSPSAGGAPCDGGACPSMAAALAGASTDACSPPERLCLIAGDLPEIIKRADFVPAASYAASYRRRVSTWRALAARIGEDPALSGYVTSLDARLELVEQDEAARRVVVESGDLLGDLRALAEAMSEGASSPGLGCPLPPSP
jgi:hypothetical protein